MRIEIVCDCSDKHHCVDCEIRKELISVVRPYLSLGVVDFIKCYLGKKEKKTK